METPNFGKEILEFNRNAVKMSFDALGACSGQAAVIADYLLGIAPVVPEEGKKTVSIYFKESQRGLANLRKYVDHSLELNWSAKDAPLKNLEAMETFCKESLSQANEIKKEARGLIEKATRQLPKEAKSIVDFWADSLNGSFEFFQNSANKNFELAKMVMAEVAAGTPATEPKAGNKP